MRRILSLKVLSLLAVLLALATAMIVAQASGVFISVENPEEISLTSAVPVPPLLAPPSGDYVRVADVSTSAPDDRPVACLVEPPQEFALSVEVNFPDIGNRSSSGDVAFFVLASVRYAGSGHTILVTTAELSPEAAKQPWVLGNETVRLDDGTRAWQTIDQPGDTPNRLVLLKDDLIITIASDLAVEKIQELALQIVVSD
jgi:hypothetical protein